MLCGLDRNFPSRIRLALGCADPVARVQIARHLASSLKCMKLESIKNPLGRGRRITGLAADRAPRSFNRHLVLFRNQPGHCGRPRWRARRLKPRPLYGGSMRCIRCGSPDRGIQCPKCTWPYSREAWASSTCEIRILTLDTNCVNAQADNIDLNQL